jgi:hypothetical protein
MDIVTKKQAIAKVIVNYLLMARRRQRTTSHHIGN